MYFAVPPAVVMLVSSVHGVEEQVAPAVWVVPMDIRLQQEPAFIPDAAQLNRAVMNIPRPLGERPRRRSCGWH